MFSKTMGLSAGEGGRVGYFVCREDPPWGTQGLRSKKYSKKLFLQKKILLPLATHLEERLTVSQSVSQSGKQSVRQSVGQAGRQAGRQKHTVWLFPVANYSYKRWETTCQQVQIVFQW